MPRPILLAALLLPACANYDFDRARLPNGGWDHQRLLADLQASGEDSLAEIVWIPLLYTEVTMFKASDPSLPKGYTLSTGGGVGPLFCANWSSQQVVGEDLAFVESTTTRGIGWNLLYDGTWQRTRTTHGDRLADRHLVLRWFGDEDVLYLPPASDASH